VLLTLYQVQEEPAFLRRMREGAKQDEDEKVNEKRRRRGSEEIIDEDEAPQVVIQDKDKGRIDEEEARAYVAAKEGAKLNEAKNRATNANAPKSGSPEPNVSSKPKVENVSLGMRRTKKPNEGVKRIHEDDKDAAAVTEKPRKSTSRKEKKLKLSFEEDE
jgi:hypothetical protein